MVRASPGRPRKFDQAVALDLAMHAFWRGGFHGTSYDDLEQSTGLRRQSLIYAFGDKRKMFDKVLAHYIAVRVEPLVSILGNRAKPAIERLEAAFAQWIADANAKDGRGCLVVNTIAEIGGREPDVAAQLKGATIKLRVSFAQCLRTAQVDGTIRPGLDPNALAALAVAAGDGAMLHSQVATDPGDMAASLAAFLQMIRAD